MPTDRASGRLRPADARRVRLHGGFWGARLERNRAVTLRHGLEQLERAGNLRNFEAARAGAGSYHGGPGDSGLVYPFLDSDVYKWLEAVGWELGRAPDGELARAADEAIALVAAAQLPDG